MASLRERLDMGFLSRRQTWGIKQARSWNSYVADRITSQAELRLRRETDKPGKIPDNVVSRLGYHSRAFGAGTIEPSGRHHSGYRRGRIYRL